MPRTRSRVPFDFRRRTELARTYMDDGALLTAADRLEQLAKDLRAAHAQEQAEMAAAMRGTA